MTEEDLAAVRELPEIRRVMPVIGDPITVLEALQQKGISIRVASPKLVMEESPESYKDVTQVVETCHQAGISKKCVKLRPIAVIKG